MLIRILAPVSIAAAVAVPSAAQVRASERGSVSQIIDGTMIEVSYGRPRLRGRTVFGGVVHWGEMWTPGANWASTLRVSKPVRVDGRPLPAGTYSIWLRPTAAEWTLYFHRQAKRYHLERPQPADMFLALPVKPTIAPPAELLTFSFSDTRRDGATLQFHWGPTTISIPIEVGATAPKRPRLTARQVAAYVGEYRAWLFAETGDSTEWHQRVFFEAGRLKGVVDEGPRAFELFPTGRPHQFWFELHDSAGPRDVELDGPIDFTVRAGRATSFRMRGIEQPLWMRGVRIDR